MAHFQNQYGAVEQIPGYDEDKNRQVDEYGNPVVQTDAYGNPVHHTAAATTTTTSGVYGTTGMRGHGGAPAAGTGLGGGLHGLHRSGSSSSSSSSEDDGQGGRRRKKKGLKEKIKEKLPGVGHKDESSQISATTTPGGYNVTGEGLQLHHQQHHEKKGVVEKIKEKLPGHHHHHHHQ